MTWVISLIYNLTIGKKKKQKGRKNKDTKLGNGVQLYRKRWHAMQVAKNWWEEEADQRMESEKLPILRIRVVKFLIQSAHVNLPSLPTIFSSLFSS